MHFEVSGRVAQLFMRCTDALRARLYGPFSCLLTRWLRKQV